MKYLYNITALREVNQTTDTEVTASFIHNRGDITDSGAMRIAKREGDLDSSDRMARIECMCYGS